METPQTIVALKNLRRQINEPVGFVPTMGFLHDGHLSLIHRARAENQSVIVSIFVNPTQFGPREDFDTYPRDLDRDLKLLRDEHVDIAFLPSVDEMYPPGASSWVEVEGITDQLEGAIRPGHFRGVATIVAKLFNIIEPNRAYFGQKDAQQVLVIQKMARDLDMDVDVVMCPTVREPDGLAMSSRNTYLSPQERRSAIILWESLQLVRRYWLDGEHNVDRLRLAMTSLIQKVPEAKIDYVSIADIRTLDELETIDQLALVSLAVRIGKTRLIDNIILGESA